jgi:hypothetical protein
MNALKDFIGNLVLIFERPTKEGKRKRKERKQGKKRPKIRVCIRLFHNGCWRRRRIERENKGLLTSARDLG